MAAAQSPTLIRQFGSPASDSATSVVSDGQNVYIAGLTEGALPGHTQTTVVDFFVAEYDLLGNEIWTRQFGAAGGSNDDGEGWVRLAVSSSGIYAASTTLGVLPGQTGSAGTRAGFVRKFDFAGNELWTRQFSANGGAIASNLAADEAERASTSSGQRSALFPARRTSATGRRTHSFESTTRVATSCGPGNSAPRLTAGSLTQPQ